MCCPHFRYLESMSSCIVYLYLHHLSPIPIVFILDNFWLWVAIGTAITWSIIQTLPGSAESVHSFVLTCFCFCHLATGAKTNHSCCLFKYLLLPSPNSEVCFSEYCYWRHCHWKSWERKIIQFRRFIWKCCQCVSHWCIKGNATRIAGIRSYYCF